MFVIFATYIYGVCKNGLEKNIKTPSALSEVSGILQNAM